MPAISANLNAFIPVFMTNFEIAYQQLSSKLREAVDTMPAEGDRMRDQILDSQEVTSYTERGGETNYTDVDASFWNVFPQPAEVANKIDEWDEKYLAKIVLPKSQLITSHAAAISRFIDNTIVRAATAAAFRGKNGTTSSSFNTTTQRVAVDYDGTGTSATTANVGMNFHKAARAQRILDDNEVPDNDRYLVMRAAQREDLYVNIIDGHSTNVSDLEIDSNQRMVKRLYGFQVIYSQRILVADTVTSAGADVASVLAFQKDAIKCAIWGDRQTFMDILPKDRHALAIRTVGNVGATRARDGGVVEILCDQSP